jgi:hypothetical protein
MWIIRSETRNKIVYTDRDKKIIAKKHDGLWWIDYGRFDHTYDLWTPIGTLKPVKTKKEAIASIQIAKKEFAERIKHTDMKKRHIK